MQEGNARENLIFPNLAPKEMASARRKVRQGLDEIERGEAIECESEEELRQIFEHIRAEAYRNLLNNKRKKAKKNMKNSIHTRILH